jgi:hypothetical protein
MAERPKAADLRDCYQSALRVYTDARAKIAQVLIDGADPTAAEHQRADSARVTLEAARAAYLQAVGVRRGS